VRIIHRESEPISINPTTGNRLELYIYGDHALGDRSTFLSAREARLLAYSLLAAAEVLAADWEGPIGDGNGQKEYQRKDYSE